jgi:hypothetical protein
MLMNPSLAKSDLVVALLVHLLVPVQKLSFHLRAQARPRPWW